MRIPILILILILSKTSIGSIKDKHKVVKKVNQDLAYKKQVLKGINRGHHTKYLAVIDNLIEYLNADILSNYQETDKRLRKQLLKNHNDAEALRQISNSYFAGQLLLTPQYQSFLEDYKTTYAVAGKEIVEAYTEITLAAYTEEINDLIIYYQRLLELQNREENIYFTYNARYNKLYRSFINLYREYERNISPYIDFMAINNIPVIEKPSKSIRKLSMIKQHITARRDKLVALLDKARKEIDQRIDNLSLITAQKEGAKIFLQSEKTRMTAEFLADANQLIKEIILAQKKVQGTDIGLLMPRYSLYQNLLKTGDLCQNIQLLRERNSYLFSGCIILTSSLAEAKKFLHTSGFTQLKINYFALKRSKKKVSKAKLIALNQFISRRNLVEAIKLHDQIILSWREG